MQFNIPTRKSKEDIQFYLEQGPKFGSVLKQLSIDISEGKLVSGLEVEESFIKQCKNSFPLQQGEYPFTKVVNERGLPFGHPICVSINDTVVHGRPDWIKFKYGDVISVDCGLALRPDHDGSYLLNFDACFTTVVKGTFEDWILEPLKALRKIKLLSQNLLTTGQITKEIEFVAEDNKMNVVVSYTGHGIGYSLHEAPHIHNMSCGISDDIFDGMCFCAEPLYSEPIENKYIFAGIEKVYLESDGWTVKTISGRKTTHFETMFCCIDKCLVDPIGITSW